MDDLPAALYTVPVCNVMMPIVEHHVSTHIITNLASWRLHFLTTLSAPNLDTLYNAWGNTHLFVSRLKVYIKWSAKCRCSR